MESRLLTAIESVVEKTLERKLESVVAQLRFWSHMQLQDFRSDSTPSVQRADFKKHLVTHYQPECNTQAQASSASSLRCMVTGVTANWGDVQVRLQQSYLHSVLVVWCEKRACWQWKAHLSVSHPSCHSLGFVQCGM